MEVKLIAETDLRVDVALQGDLDTASVAAAELPLMTSTVSAHKDATIDLSGVGYAASLGLGLLVQAVKAARGHRRRIIFYGVQPQIRDVLHHARLDSLLELADDHATAVARLGAEAPA